MTEITDAMVERAMKAWGQGIIGVVASHGAVATAAMRAALDAALNPKWSHKREGDELPWLQPGRKVEPTPQVCEHEWLNVGCAIGSDGRTEMVHRCRLCRARTTTPAERRKAERRHAPNCGLERRSTDA